MLRKKLIGVSLSLAMLLTSIAFPMVVLPDTAKSEAVDPLTPLTGIMPGYWPTTQISLSSDPIPLSTHRFDLIHSFVNSNQNLGDWIDFMDYVHSQGAVNLLTLELQKGDSTGDYTTVDINSGYLDNYFIYIANQLKSWQNGSEVWIRLMHEVNGNWYAWSVGDSTVNTNESYIEAFRRIVSIFRSCGANNVKFIYNVNCENLGSGASFMGAYPGNDYVYAVSIDGYNWGTTQSWSKWKSFREIFDAPYQALTESSDRPVIIAEYASTEIGGNKAAWISDAMYQIHSGAYPELIAASWLNAQKETDWRVQSSIDSLFAYMTNIPLKD